MIRLRKVRSRPLKISRFVTTTVFVFFVLGCVLVVIGQTAYVSQLLPGLIPAGSPLHTIIRSAGAALIGSGVFTAIIKSNEYSAIFAAIIGEIIWSKAFIDKRSDKEEIWSIVSRSIYQEKFPAISDEIEKIITSKYFPTEHQYYIDKYEMVLNITDIDEFFCQYDEIIKATIVPSHPDVKFEYRIGSSIALPDQEGEDLSELVLESIKVNGKKINLSHEAVKSNNEMVLEHNIPLLGSSEYRVEIKRKKVLYKKTNPAKRFLCTSIIKNMTLMVIIAASNQLAFYSLGTVYDFTESEEQINNGIKLISWSYSGILLHRQGFIVIFR